MECCGQELMDGVHLHLSNRTGPAIAVNLEHNLAFGTIRQGPQYLTLQIFNVGLEGVVVEDLAIESVQRLMGSASFSVLPTPSTPAGDSSR